MLFRSSPPAGTINLTYSSSLARFLLLWFLWFPANSRGSLPVHVVLCQFLWFSGFLGSLQVLVILWVSSSLVVPVFLVVPGILVVLVILRLL